LLPQATGNHSERCGASAMRIDFNPGALALAAMILCAGAGDAASADTSDKPPETLAIDVGVSGSSLQSLYGYFGALYAPSGNLDQSGFRVRLGSVDGQFSYPQAETGTRIYGVGAEASFLAGYSFNKDNSSLLLMLGPDVANISLSPADPTNPAQSTGFGAKALMEFYSNPTPNTKIDFEVGYSTIFDSYYVRLDPGYAAFGKDIFVGPQLVFLGNDQFQQWRLGAEVAGFKLGRAELGVTAGYLRDREQGGGAYAGLDLYVRY